MRPNILFPVILLKNNLTYSFKPPTVGALNAQRFIKNQVITDYFCPIAAPLSRSGASGTWGAMVNIK